MGGGTHLGFEWIQYISELTAITHAYVDHFEWDVPLKPETYLRRFWIHSQVIPAPRSKWEDHSDAVRVCLATEECIFPLLPTTCQTPSSLGLPLGPWVLALGLLMPSSLGYSQIHSCFSLCTHDSYICGSQWLLQQERRGWQKMALVLPRL